MKHPVFSLLIAMVLLLLAPALLPAQCRIGYYDETAVIAAMPEAQAAEREAKRYLQKCAESAEQIWENLQLLRARADSLATAGTLEQLHRGWDMIQKAERRLEVVEEYGRVSCRAKADELMQPIHDKVAAAVKAVMLAQGLTAVVNRSKYEYDPFRIEAFEYYGFTFGAGKPDFEAEVRPESLPPLRQTVHMGGDAVDVQALVLKQLGLEEK